MIREVVYLDFLDALLQGDNSRCGLIVQNVLAQGADIRDVYINIFQKSMYRVGKLWEQGNLSIAQEHIASQIIDCLVSTAFMMLPHRTKCHRKAVITCIDKEFHQIGAKMVSNIFELNGWCSYFMGGNTPGREVLDVIKERRPDIVGISFSFYMNYLRFLETLDNIRNNFPEQAIIVGGQGLTEELTVILSKDYPQVKYFKCIQALDEYLQALDEVVK